ncbi:MAG: CDP-diacylglycerol--serine O-phosphatidyltransferase [Gammaproteobacteria bacterium]|nr:CDP-diacylglycerol--serine O-phosphatidyltransferase [Gammaproteobacteria bacterium]MCZ6771343.1 CDP-diacylglycerol--serine O-phosphatidyltransferase [Pseudomonadota bacterium]
MRVIHSHRPNKEPDEPRPASEERRRSGIYLLPNLFTTGALFAGFYGIVAAINGHFEPAAIAVFIAMVLDGMDGRIARLTNTQSDFGAEYDSLADMASFGLAPALIVYEWSLFELGKLGWLAAFLYTSATALRLARFNTQVGNADKRFFKGLPSPAAAALLASIIWFGSSIHVRESSAALAVTLLVTVGAALLMVSNVRYYSFKDLDLRGRVPFVSVLAVVMVFVLISLDPATVLLAMFTGYTISGPVLTWMQRRRTRAARKEKKRA